MKKFLRPKPALPSSTKQIQLVRESGCDWLSVAVGNIHGTIADATCDQKKPTARLDVDHIAALSEATGIPPVLHARLKMIYNRDTI